MPFSHISHVQGDAFKDSVINLMTCGYHQCMIKQYLDIGAVVREMRQARGVTQSQLAGALGIDRTALSRIENDERELTARELLRIAGVFGEDVCTVAGNVHREQPPTERAREPHRHEMMAVPTPASLPTIRIEGGWTITVGFEEPGLWVPKSAS